VRIMKGYKKYELIKVEVEGRNIILFLRDGEGKKKIVKVKDFYPYFYTKTPEKYKNVDGVVRIEGGYKSLYGEDLWKIIVNHPGIIPKLRDENSYEADIPYDIRFMIDMNIRGCIFVRSDSDKYEVSVKDIRGEGYDNGI